jgi:hypothetical protein
MSAFQKQNFQPQRAATVRTVVEHRRTASARGNVVVPTKAVVVNTAVTTSTTRAVAVEQSAAPQTSSRKKLVFGWIQDVSGSMNGDRMDTSMAGLEFMFQEVFEPNDFLGVVTYNDFITTLHLPMLVKKVDVAREKTAVINGLKKGAHNDKCYDALGAAIEGLKSLTKDSAFRSVTMDAVYQLLLVTDGGDNASLQLNFDSCAALVAKPGLPNFHLTVVAVGMSPHDKAKFQKLCSVGHATFLEAANLRDLKTTLERVGHNVRSRLVVQTTTTITSATMVSVAGGSVTTARIPPPRPLIVAKMLAAPPLNPVMGFITGGMSMLGLLPAAVGPVLPRRALASHAMAASGAKAAVCTFWLKGCCKRGDACRYRHGL